MQVSTPTSVDLWAVTTFLTLALPDARLNARGVFIASRLAAKPMDSIPQAFDSWGDTKAAYRFIENERVTKEKLLEPVVDATAKLCKKRPRILCVQDTTELTFPNSETMEDLGPVNDSESARGMFLHSVLAVGEDGVAIGLLDQQYWSRDPNERGSAARRKERPIEEKESFKWIGGIRRTRAVINAQLPQGDRPVLLHVFDREGDIHEVFEEIVSAGDQAVIRCTHNRRVKDPKTKHAHQKVRSQPVLGRTTIEIPRKPGQAKRTAQVEIRACRVTLNPNRSVHPERNPVSLSLVELWEPNSPDGMGPVHWRLWTTERVDDLETALWVIEIYRMRWQIEEVHLVLKSGCKVEELQFETAERTTKVVTLYSPVAVRIVQLRTRARTEPESPCTVVLEQEEWHVLYAAIRKQPPPPETDPPTLRQAVLWIGRLGGHLNRKGDGMPGVRTLWRGWRDLQLMIPIYRAGRASA